MSIINRKSFDNLSRLGEGKKIEEKYLGEIDIKDNKNITLCSQMGTGKTFSIINILKKIEKGKRVLIISPRISLTNSSIKRFANEGIIIESYQNPLININTEKNVFLQVESFYKLSTRFDIVIIDEFSTVITQLFSQHHGDKFLINFQTFEMLVSLAKYLIISCADLDYKICEKLINEYRKKEKKTLVVHNSFKPRKDYRSVLVESVDEFIDKIEQELMKGKNVILISGSRAFLTAMANRIISSGIITEKETKIYTSATDDISKKEDLENLDEAWSGKRFLAYTNTISVGIDYTRIHYDSLFMYCNKNTVGSREMIQMSCRCRFLKEKIIRVHLEKDTDKEGSLPDDEESVKECVSNVILNKNSTIKYFQLLSRPDRKIDLENISEDYQIVLEPIDFEKFKFFALVYVLIEINKNKNNYTKELFLHFDRLGITYEIEELENKELNKTTEGYINAIGKSLNKATEMSIFEARKISEEEFISLNDKQLKTNEEKFQIKKYQLYSVVKPEYLSKSFIDKDIFDLLYHKYFQMIRYRDFLKFSQETRLINHTQKIVYEHKYKVFNFDKGKHFSLSGQFELILNFLSCKGEDIFDRKISRKEILALSDELDYDIYKDNLGYQGKYIRYDDKENKILQKTIRMINCCFNLYMGCKFEAYQKHYTLQRPEFEKYIIILV